MTTRRLGLRSFEAQLKEFRATTGIAFQDVAEKMGVSPTYISQIIKRTPSAEQIERIAAALGVSPEEFDAYHIARFPDDVRTGDPTAVSFAQLLINVNKMSERKRARFLSDALSETEG